MAYEIRQHYHCCWCVDPIDGTKEFVKRTGEFTVNIALLHGPTPVLGVVMVPTTGVLYYAVQGGGAFKREVCPIACALSACQCTHVGGVRRHTCHHRHIRAAWTCDWQCRSLT